MKAYRTPLLVLLLVAVAAACQLARHYPELPQTVAVHFDAAGRPNGWSDKDAFVLTYGATEAVLVLVALGLAFLGHKIPANFLNIPNCDYWLAPDRRDATIRFAWSRVIWLEAMALAFLIAIGEIIFRANRTPGQMAPTSDLFIILAVFIVAVIWQSISMMLRFRIPQDGRPEAASQDPSYPREG